MTPIKFFSIVSILLAGCVSCSTSEQPAANRDSKTDMGTDRQSDQLQPGVHDVSIVSESGEILRYTLVIPPGYDPGQPTPLIVALHYGGKVTPHFARGFVEALVLPGLGELNAIVLAPDSIAGAWNKNKNETAVLELMDHVTTNYNIDKSRTLLTGFSMGGHGTWQIGSRHQDLFSALIPIAGAPLVDNDIVWTTPIYIIHSRADDVVPIEATEKYLAKLTEERRSGIKFVAVDDLPHFQTATFALPLRDAVPWLKQIWKGK